MILKKDIAHNEWGQCVRFFKKPKKRKTDIFVRKVTSIQLMMQPFKFLEPCVANIKMNHFLIDLTNTTFFGIKAQKAKPVW